MSSGMFSLCTALGMALTSFIDRAKQSAYSVISSWTTWRWSCVTSGPIVTSCRIFVTHSGLWGLLSRVNRGSGFSFKLGAFADVVRTGKVGMSVPVLAQSLGTL